MMMTLQRQTRVRESEGRDLRPNVALIDWWLTPIIM